jgi:hypothetical protein
VHVLLAEAALRGHDPDLVRVVLDDLDVPTLEADLSSSFTTLRTTSASKTLAIVVAIVRSPPVVVGCPGPSARVVPGLGRVEALDDGLLAPERDPLLGVASEGLPCDPDLFGGAQALLDP